MFMKAVINYYTYNKKINIFIRMTIFMESGRLWVQVKKFK